MVKQRKSSIKTDLRTVYRHGLSLRRYQLSRRTQFGEFREHGPNKCHTGRLDKYAFDENLAAEILQEEGGVDKSLTNMQGKWRALAKRVGLRCRNNKACGNPAQVRITK